MTIPRISFVRISEKLLDENVLVIFSFQGEGAIKKQLARTLKKNDVTRLLVYVARRKFQGALKDTLHLPLNDDTLVVLIGLGDEKKHTEENFRKAGNRAVQVLRQLNEESAGLILPHSNKFPSQETTTYLAEGMLLGSYEFDRYKSAPKDAKPTPLAELHIAVDSITRPLERSLERTTNICNGVFLSRDLANENSDEVTPSAFEAEVRRVARQLKLRCTVLAGEDVKKNNLNLLYAVGKGAETPPRLIVLEYRGRTGKEWDTALVGKGITFDTGGLNIKPAGPMTNQMHMDMAAAATVLATISVASTLKLKKNILGVMAMAENAVDAKSTKPGTIVRSHSGKTVEITNTDAEGRLVLADALSYTVEKYAPREMVDLATLTGAILVTLGSEAAGIMANNVPLTKKLVEAGKKVHERLWELPLFEEYESEVKGTFSDLKNLSFKMNGAYASSILGAKFLEQFVGKTPWAHLDIAGTAILDASQDYMPQNGTGFGVRLLIEYLSK